MNTIVHFILASLAWVASRASTEKHHDVIFDTVVSPGIKSESPPQIDVAIGEFLDISCPQYDPDQKKNVLRFHIYDLDKKSYENCDLEEEDEENGVRKRKKKVFSCVNPIKQNKLTIKFQRRSPYPYGFTFKEKETHYYVGIPNNRSDCKEAIVLKVYVKGKEDENPVIPPLDPVNKEDVTKSTTTSSTTRKPKTTSRSTTSKFIARLTTSKVNTGRSSKQERGGNSSRSMHISNIASFLLPLITLRVLMSQNT